MALHEAFSVAEFPFDAAHCVLDRNDYLHHLYTTVVNATERKLKCCTFFEVSFCLWSSADEIQI